jgi:hypothetical protein
MMGGVLLQKGQLSQRSRMIRIKNVLTQQEHVLEVPSEELLSEIRTRYLSINSHAFAYIWKAFLHGAVAGGALELRELDMNRTLSQNGLKDEAQDLEDCMLDDDFYIPVLHLYWSDDLSIA